MAAQPLGNVGGWLSRAPPGGVAPGRGQAVCGGRPRPVAPRLVQAGGGYHASVGLPITTERLIIRPFTLADLTAMHAVWSDPQVMTPIPSQSYDWEKSQAKLGEKISHQARHGFGRWAVIETASGTVIGEYVLQYLEGGPEIELGYKLARPCWGRGLAAEAAQACLGWALAERPEAVVAIVDPTNTRSARILARIGMAREGTRYCFDHLWDRYKAPRP
jgi:[ribosomal protein S5]-alanine N-acetyltransferase